MLKKVQAVVQKTSRKNVTSTVLIFVFFSVFLMNVMCGKNTVNLKRTALKWEKKKHMHIEKEPEAH